MPLIILLVGCVNLNELHKDEPTIVDSFSNLIDDDPLINLEPEEFKKEYAKLPNDYKIKIENKKIIEMYFLGETLLPIIKFDENGRITKKQEEKITTLGKYNISESKYAKIKDSFSLKGLRYFPNLINIELFQCHLSNTNELKYLDNLRALELKFCDFKLPEMTKEVHRLLTDGKIKDIRFDNCNITNIDFLSGFSNLSDIELSFRGNQINDLYALSDLKKIDVLDLSDNQIKDITSLSNLEEIQCLYLSKNQIKDIAICSKINQTEKKKWYDLDLSDNQIQDITPLSNLKNSYVIAGWKPTYRYFCSFKTEKN